MMATKRARRGWLPLAILCAVGLTSLVGCGGIRRLPVSGTVTLDDQPLNGGALSFAPDPAKGNKSQITGNGPVKEGRYELQTTAINRADSGPGVPPGWYKVFYKTLNLSTKKNPLSQLEVNDKFKSAETTPISVEVKDNPEPGAYDFNFTK